MTDPTLLTHIVTGLLGIGSGFIALYTAKGATLHRKSGMVFVYSMITMAVLGAGLAVVRGKSPASNVPVGALTAYMVFTGLTTVRTLPSRFRWLDFAGMMVALTVGLVLVTFGAEALASADGTRYGVPSFPYFLFATVGLIAGAGDVRMIRGRALQSASRLRRHVWRMCLALALAAFSFVPRLAKSIPPPVRLPAIFAPVLIVLVTMVYWLWRVRGRRSVRGAATVAVRRAA